MFTNPANSVVVTEQVALERSLASSLLYGRRFDSRPNEPLYRKQQDLVNALGSLKKGAFVKSTAGSIRGRVSACFPEYGAPTHTATVEVELSVLDAVSRILKNKADYALFKIAFGAALAQERNERRSRSSRGQRVLGSTVDGTEPTMKVVSPDLPLSAKGLEPYTPRSIQVGHGAQLLPRFSDGPNAWLYSSSIPEALSTGMLLQLLPWLQVFKQGYRGTQFVVVLGDPSQAEELWDMFVQFMRNWRSDSGHIHDVPSPSVFEQMLIDALRQRRFAVAYCAEAGRLSSPLLVLEQQDGRYEIGEFTAPSDPRTPQKVASLMDAALTFVEPRFAPGTIKA